MADRITVELSERDVERLSARLFERVQSMMAEGDVPSYWVPKLLKLKQVAEILGFPLSKVHTKIKAGEIESLRFDDKTIRVDPRALDRYVKAHPNLKVNRETLKRHLEESRALSAMGTTAD